MDMDSEFKGIRLPDWRLIDEISMPLVEQGIGVFDVLQQSLPSIVLAQVDKIDEEWTETRLIKMFKIAQFQLRYLLQSQQDLVKKLDGEKEKVQKLSKENQHFRKTYFNSDDSPKELFKCEECSKIFLDATFLMAHIQKRHRNNGQIPDAHKEKEPEYRILS
uniref:C2H2-type domain-containing protein n=1 Tax=Acrobeloides nanus TaxID=290746 RepID=A0A914BUI1_9BILA